MPIPFDNSYARLPQQFFAAAQPLQSPSPALIQVNEALAAELGIDSEWLKSPAGLDVLSGRAIAQGSEPIAQAYAGHQFGNFVPQLGDGRAILLGEVVDRAGRRRDIQLKGAGRTPFSRGGDGRAALGPVLREYLVSEAMAALGIPTTRALAAVTTGEPVVRETILPGAMLTRVASSHIRVGTFQFFAARGDEEAVRHLADHVIARHYPAAAENPQPYRALLDAVISAQAALVARWLLVGFIHGVMNTDNMSVAGETIDYGPCAFMDVYDAATVFSSIDRAGRYAYGNQPRIAHWNLTRLAETLLPLLDEDENAAVEQAQDALGGFGAMFEQTYFGGLRRKVGLLSDEPEDMELMNALLTRMTENQVDFTLLFRALGRAASGEDEPARALFVDPTAFDAWATQWRARLARDGQAAADRRAAMDRVNPAFIPRNHQVEAMITAAVERQEYTPFHRMLDVLSRPFEDQPDALDLAEPPLPHERVAATFCGT
ncbi:YdiU family protein [Sphingomonas sp. PL-96]|uniref:protein adenylyltransferase SelO n=1 Tax=Sphingomonas sp. PL-96 TaxID=2887201 RepID=UPI001E4D0FFD|nr:YdiU family protein [Sphingomonas sp. PL-96]MCC2978023.1 YdiU family protein [Sphingomonas sp. PL-96]